MLPFKITLPNNAVLTGLHNLPARSPSTLNTSSSTPEPIPIIVALHGGTYTAKYFDVDVGHTASIVSNGLGVPIVAINRPGYHDSTSFYPIPEGSSYPEEYGNWLHRHILPAIWSEFGKPSGCDSIVLLSHSLGTTGAVIAAAMHAAEADTDRQYPLAGMIISGFGTHPCPSRHSISPTSPAENTITFTPEFKDEMMIQKGCAHPDIYQYTEQLNHPMSIDEIGHWKSWAETIEVPVMIGIASHDRMWSGTKEHLDDFSDCFTKSVRVDGSVIRGAPHNMEMSYWSKGWYARCFGFAMESAVSLALL